MSLPDIGFGSKTNHDQLGGTTYPRYMVMYAERKETSDSTPNDEDPTFGFRGATTHTTGTDAKVYMGILNGVLPTPEHNITVSNLSAGIVGETDRVTVKPGIVLNPTTTTIAPDTKGSLMYDTGTDELKYYDGSWQIVSAGGLSAHVLDSETYHTATGLTVGWVISADSATTFSWKAPSGGTDDDAIHDNVANEITAITPKTTLGSTDEFVLEDGGASFVKKAVTFANIESSISLANLGTRTHASLSDAPTSAHHVRYADSEVKDVITAEIVNGQSIDLAIDALISDHAGDYDAHHDVATGTDPIYIDSPAQDLKFAWWSEDFRLHDLLGRDYLRIGTDTPSTDEVLTFNGTNCVWSTPAVSAHVLATTGPHTDTLPWADLNKTGSSLADLATRAHSNLSDAPTDAHHNEAHVLATTGPHSGTLPWTDLNKTGSSLADLATRAHSNLSDAPTSAHHVRYADSEVITVITAECEEEQIIDDAIDALIVTHKNIATAHQNAPALISIHAQDNDVHHTPYTDTMTEAVITAELVDGQSINNAIDNLIVAHANDNDAHHALVTVQGSPLLLSTQHITFLYNTNHFSLGVDPEELLIGTDTPGTNEVLTWNGTDAVWIAPTVSAHVLATTGPHTGSLPWSDLSKTGSSLADLATRTHASLSDAPADAHHVAFVLSDFTTAFAAESLANLATRTHASLSDAPTSAHHVRYADSEVITVITAECEEEQIIDDAIDALILTHKNIAGAHHAKYLDSEAVAAVIAENPLALTNALKIGGNSIEDSTGAEMIGFTGAGYIDFLASQGTPNNADVLAWNDGNSRWEVTTQTGGGGGISGSGTNNVLTKWLSAGSTIQDSIISDDGSTATVAGDLVVSGGDITTGLSDNPTVLLKDNKSGDATYWNAANRVLATISSWTNDAGNPGILSQIEFRAAQIGSAAPRGEIVLMTKDAVAAAWVDGLKVDRFGNTILAGNLTVLGDTVQGAIALNLIAPSGSMVVRADGSGQHMYFDAGGSFYWRDEDSARNVVASLVSSTGRLLLGYAANTADPIEILRFNTERAWSFRKRSTGASTRLCLESDTGGKQFYIGYDDGVAWASKHYVSNVAADCRFDAYQLYVNGTSVITSARAIQNVTTITTSGDLTVGGTITLDGNNIKAAVAGVTNDFVNIIGGGQAQDGAYATIYGHSHANVGSIHMVLNHKTGASNFRIYDYDGVSAWNVRWSVDKDGNMKLNAGTSVNELSIDGTLGGNSDDAVPTEKAVKTYVGTAAVGKVHTVVQMPSAWSGDAGTTMKMDTGTNSGWYASGAGSGGYYYWGFDIPSLIVGQKVDAVQMRMYDDIVGASRYAQLYKHNGATQTLIDSTPSTWGISNTWTYCSFNDDFTVESGTRYFIRIKEETGDPIRIQSLTVIYKL